MTEERYIRVAERRLMDELARRATGHCEVDALGKEVKCTTEWLASFMEHAILYGTAWYEHRPDGTTRLVGPSEYLEADPPRWGLTPEQPEVK